LKRAEESTEVQELRIIIFETPGEADLSRISSHHGEQTRKDGESKFSSAIEAFVDIIG
jgi:hypothetical protein